MKLPTLLCLAVVVTAGTSRICAQATPRPTPPPPPYVGVTPDFSAWSIARYTIPGLGSQTADAVMASLVKPPKPESVTSVTKTGRVRYQVRKLVTGEQEDIWYEHGSRITMESMWKMPVFQADTSSPKSPIGPDFPEFSWVAAGNFVGTQGDQNATYFVFETQVTEGNAVQAKEYGYKLTSTFNRAYINADTRLPFLLQSGDVLQRYIYQAAPTTPLEVPAEYQKMFDGYEKRKGEMTKKPIAP